MKITCAQCVAAMKDLKRATARTIAQHIGNTTTRGVATALRQATEDGRLATRYKGGIAIYRYVRTSPTARPKRRFGEPFDGPFDRLLRELGINRQS